MNAASLYVCVACYRSASTGAGVCSRCAVDRLPLADPQVLEDLQKEAERRLQKKAYRTYFWISVAAFIVTLPLFPMQILFIPVFWIAAGIILAWLGTTAYAALRPSSALALMGVRKQRAAHELAPAPNDPAGGDLDVTLAFLGARVEP